MTQFTDSPLEQIMTEPPQPTSHARVCHNPKRERHSIADGARRIDIRPLAINWGASDLRDEWRGEYTFCSFQCLADWSSERAVQHDTHVLVEGQKPEGDES